MFALGITNNITDINLGLSLPFQFLTCSHFSCTRRTIQKYEDWQ